MAEQFAALRISDPITKCDLTLPAAREAVQQHLGRFQWLVAAPGLTDESPITTQLHVEALQEAVILLGTRLTEQSQEVWDEMVVNVRECKLPSGNWGQLRRDLEDFAEELTMSLEEVLLALQAQEESLAARLSLEIQKLETKHRDELVAQAQLPEARDLDLLMRYEAHLGRQLQRLGRFLKDVRAEAPAVTASAITTNTRNCEMNSVSLSSDPPLSYTSPNPQNCETSVPPASPPFPPPNPRENCETNCTSHEQPSSSAPVDTQATENYETNSLPNRPPEPAPVSPPNPNRNPNPQKISPRSAPKRKIVQAPSRKRGTVSPAARRHT